VRYVCVGGDQGAGPLPPFQVSLVVAADGSITRQSATWGLSRADPQHSPAIGIDFAMEGGKVTRGARDARVLALVGLQPPPAAKTADVMLLLDGVEVARRPWRMFAERMAAPAKPPGGAAPAFFVGVVPFVATDEAADAGLRRLLAQIGQHPASLEVRIVGDTGV